MKFRYWVAYSATALTGEPVFGGKYLTFDHPVGNILPADLMLESVTDIAITTIVPSELIQTSDSSTVDESDIGESDRVLEANIMDAIDSLYYAKRVASYEHGPSSYDAVMAAQHELESLIRCICSVVRAADNFVQADRIGASRTRAKDMRLILEQALRTCMENQNG